MSNSDPSNFLPEFILGGIECTGYPVDFFELTDRAAISI